MLAAAAASVTEKRRKTHGRNGRSRPFGGPRARRSPALPSPAPVCYDIAVPAALLNIYLRPAARLPAQPVPRALAIAGQGLEGDHAGGGKRQVTLLDVESWRDACRELGRDLDPAVRRANLLVAGIDLGAAIGSRIVIGEVAIEVLGETRPCELMDDDGRLGLQMALRPERRGGVYGRITTGGELAVGMSCRVEPNVGSARPHAGGHADPRPH